jgi:hypothetical protein
LEARFQTFLLTALPGFLKDPGAFNNGFHQSHLAISYHLLQLISMITEATRGKKASDGFLVALP